MGSPTYAVFEEQQPARRTTVSYAAEEEEYESFAPQVKTEFSVVYVRFLQQCVDNIFFYDVNILSTIFQSMNHIIFNVIKFQQQCAGYHLVNKYKQTKINAPCRLHELQLRDAMGRVNFSVFLTIAK